MREERPPRRILRRTGAVLAGVIAGIILQLGSDEALRAAGIFPALGQPMSDGLFLLATAHRVLWSVVSGYITARLAPDRPITHAMVLGVLGMVANVVGTVVTWNEGPEFGPKWYPISLALLSVPCAWAGAKLRANEPQV